ncbi:ABC transporter substrate-binding protein [Streptomyces tateyamensis]|uniref:ABC transporter substrate-binding protein n=1 Tax=Streptomyces tateyamensis TaxID=565073 RepID=A0A2V4NSW2_9ACTN|nr:ABC transporter substrate-binding protein [Streptomyces tateyamensis]
MEPWDLPRPWWRGRLGSAALLVVLALTGSGIYLGTRPASTSCADGVAHVGADSACVGLTDGAFPFSPDLKDVFGRIRTENSSVREAGAKPGGTPWVSVVYLMPMVQGQDGSTTADSIRHEIEGAYAAQLEANHRYISGDSPKIRLLLGHTGATDIQRDYTLGRIEAQRSADHVVAVAGLGTSTESTKAAILRLTKEDIAAFGAVITADDLQDIPGLVRVAPPNSDEATAAAAYLAKDYPNAKVLVVQDRKSDDLYSRTLADQFRKSYPPELQDKQPMEYDSSKSDVSTYFLLQMANLCNSSPDVVFFAGRGIHLPRFLEPLSHRSCAGKQVTVISGDDASEVVQSPDIGLVRQDLQQGNITLLYTGLAHPGAWQVRPQSYARTAIEPFQDGGEFKAAFPQESLTDGQAVMGHDAVLTAVTAIRSAAAGGAPVTGPDVVQMLTSLYGTRAVSGASGLISLGADGNPKNKAIPIVRLTPDAQVSTVAVTSSTGTPPDGHP